ncbi:MAG: hypothetical protein KDD92_14765 [Caldilineaceae bacterium]|nr:hypothetical protein [Caldilineaceae bacterium]
MAKNRRLSNSTLVEQVIDRALNSLDDADAQAAAQRINELRPRFSQENEAVDLDALIRTLIQRKAVQTGMVGAATSGAAFIPGLGTLTTLVLGTAADLSVSLRLQTELVLEIAAASGHEFSSDEWRNAVMLVTGVSVGAEQLFTEAGKRLARKSSRRFAGRSFVKAIPVIGIIASAAANMLATYVIGKRAQAYFVLGPGAMESPADIVRSLSGVDERMLLQALGDAFQTIGSALATGITGAGRQVASAGATGLGAIPVRLTRGRNE